MSYEDDDTRDLLGFDEPEPPRRKSPRTVAKERQNKAAQVLEELRTRARRDPYEGGSPAAIKAVNISDVQHGVTVGWLATVFGMDPTTVRKKLRDATPIQRRKAGHVYDLKHAAQFLVTPVFDIETHLKQMRPSELPPHLQESYWSAMRKRQQWEADAGHLWRTESVMEVLGEVFQTIKFTMQLWPDMVDRSMGLSPEQRDMLIKMADSLQADIHKKLVQMPNIKKTPPSSAEAGVVEVVPTEDDDASRLV